MTALQEYLSLLLNHITTKQTFIHLMLVLGIYSLLTMGLA